MRRTLGIPWQVWAALVLAMAVTHAIEPDGWFGSATYLSAGCIAVTAGWIAVARRGPYLWFAVFLALGLTSSTLGDVLYEVSPELAVGSAAAPGDLLWLGGYVGVCAALFLLLRLGHRHRRFDFEGLIDATVVLVVGLVVMWEFTISAIVADGQLTTRVQLMALLYPVLDVVLLVLVARVLGQHRTPAGLLVAAGASGWLLADFANLVATPDGAHAGWVDGGWTIGGVLLGAAALHGASVHSVEVPAVPVLKVGLGRIALALLPLTVPWLIELRAYVTDGEDVNALTLMAVSLLLLTLAYLRAARLVQTAREAEQELISRERRARALAEHSSDAAVVIDADRRIVDDHNLATLVGYPGRRTVGADLLLLVAPDDIEEADNVFRRSLAAPGQMFDIVLRVDHGQGRQVWLGARVVNLLHDPDVAGVVVNLHDVTGRKQAEEELNHQAFHDALTGLANRALFRDRLDHALDRNARTGSDPAVIFLDLDGFKTVNDGLGHDTGDRLLQEVAGRLLMAVRRGDTVGRLGGDEFAILIEQSSRALDEATTVADRVQQALTLPFVLGGHEVTVSASLGIAIGDGDCSPADLLRDADVAMYRSKTTGKAKWTVYDPDMRLASMERLQLEGDLRHALELDQLRLEYQPVVELVTERVVGFEALLRWDHPRLGVIPPDRFIPLAEDTGLIQPIGRWVLAEATRVAAGWQRRFGSERHIGMSVNVSARQLVSAELVTDVTDALVASGLEPSSLVLEITETVLVSDPAMAAERLHELRGLGVRLAIDDFGTGYSSLSYLRHFPVDILKIDRSFINTITDRGQVPAILRGLLDLGRTLQLQTVAEGVELDVQRRHLRQESCDLAQGFLFAHSLPAEEAEALLAGMGQPATGRLDDLGTG
jgi:diguanylate cyclase (GGDEF)-like protein/PAS domain S-box-containing protein